MDRNSLKLPSLLTVFIGFFGLLAGSPGQTADRNWGDPIVIAHRGASGERPEHTLAAYELALIQGADFIELDLVSTSDGVLIARHENALAMVEVDELGGIVLDSHGAPTVREATTDVAERPEFADRLAVKSIDGRMVGGWFSEDFSFEEIASLRARERMPRIRPSNRRFDDRYAVPSLAEVIALIRQWETDTGSRPGLYLEIKHPTYFQHEGKRLDGAKIGVDLGRTLVAALEAHEFLDEERIFIQAFEVAPLIELHDHMARADLDLPLIQLFGDVFNRRYRAAPRDMIFHAARGSSAVYGELETLIEGGIQSNVSYAELATPEVLEYMARRYAAGIGPPRSSIMLTEVQVEGGRVEQTFTGSFGGLEYGGGSGSAA
jgi:glycerophosphoryl diester phosphodiesterase